MGQMVDLDNLLDMDDVMQLVNLTDTRIRQLVRTNEFPPPVKRFRAATAWLRGDIEYWKATRVRKTGGKKKTTPDVQAVPGA